MDLRLRRTEIEPGRTAEDDWCVMLDGRTIGRILLVHRAVTQKWLEEAQAAFRARLEEVGPFDPVRMALLPRNAGDRGDGEIG